MTLFARTNSPRRPSGRRSLLQCLKYAILSHDVDVTVGWNRTARAEAPQMVDPRNDLIVHTLLKGSAHDLFK